MSTYAFTIGQVVGGNTVYALPTGTGIYGSMYEMQRPDGSLFYDFLSASQMQVENVSIQCQGDNVNLSNPFPITFGPFMTATPTTASITGSSTSILPANPGRKWFGVINDATSSSTAYIGYGYAPVASALGPSSITIPPGASYEPPGLPYGGQMFALTASGSNATLHITEGAQ